MLAYTCAPPYDYTGPAHGVMIASSLDSPAVDSGCDAEQPRFSPDGTKILVLRLEAIATISPGETATTQNGITRTCNTVVGLETSMPVAVATWSPDGTKIAFIGGYAPLGLLSADGKTVLWKFNGRGKYGHVEVSTSTLDWACTGACR